jgi:hypothetical protein
MTFEEWWQSNEFSRAQFNSFAHIREAFENCWNAAADNGSVTIHSVSIHRWIDAPSLSWLSDKLAKWFTWTRAKFDRWKVVLVVTLPMRSTQSTPTTTRVKLQNP